MLTCRLNDATIDTVDLMEYEQMTQADALAVIIARYNLNADEVVAVRVHSRDAYEARS